MGAAGSGDVPPALGDGSQGVPTAGSCVPGLVGADIPGRCPQDAFAPRRARGQGWGMCLNLALTYIEGGNPAAPAELGPPAPVCSAPWPAAPSCAGTGNGHILGRRSRGAGSDCGIAKGTGPMLPMV